MSINFNNTTFDFKDCKFINKSTIDCDYVNLSYTDDNVKRVIKYIKSLQKDNSLKVLEFIISVISNENIYKEYLIIGNKNTGKRTFINLLKFIFKNKFNIINSNEYNYLPRNEENIIYCITDNNNVIKNNDDIIIYINNTNKIDNDNITKITFDNNVNNKYIESEFDIKFKEAFLWLIIEEYKRKKAIN